MNLECEADWQGEQKREWKGNAGTSRQISTKVHLKVPLLTGMVTTMLFQDFNFFLGLLIGSQFGVPLLPCLPLSASPGPFVIIFLQERAHSYILCRGMFWILLVLVSITQLLNFNVPILLSRWVTVFMAGVHSFPEVAKYSRVHL